MTLKSPFWLQWMEAGRRKKQEKNSLTRRRGFEETCRAQLISTFPIFRQKKDNYIIASLIHWVNDTKSLAEVLLQVLALQILTTTSGHSEQK